MNLWHEHHRQTHKQASKHREETTKNPYVPTLPPSEIAPVARKFTARRQKYVKKYKDYASFKSAGNGRTQIVMYLAHITKPIIGKSPSKSNLKILESYSSIYCAGITLLSSDSWNIMISKIEAARPQGEDVNAFYFLHTLANNKYSIMIFFSFSFYVVGFAALGVIGYQNIIFVL